VCTLPLLPLYVKTKVSAFKRYRRASTSLPLTSSQKIHGKVLAQENPACHFHSASRHRRYTSDGPSGPVNTPEKALPHGFRTRFGVRGGVFLSCSLRALRVLTRSTGILGLWREAPERAAGTGDTGVVVPPLPCPCPYPLPCTPALQLQPAPCAEC
jgi:hypothetical protein